MVHPILEHGNIIWGPHFNLDQIAILITLDHYHHYIISSAFTI